MSKKNQHKTIKVAASAALVASVIVPVASASADFKDVTSTHIFKTEIDYLASREIVKGYVDGTFKPSKSFSRKEIVYLIGQYLESLGKPIPSDATTKLRFTDISKEDARFKGYAALVFDGGIFEGRASGALDGKATITREESAKVMISFLNHYLGVDMIEFAKSRNTYNPNAVSDLNVASAWARDYILALRELGVTRNVIYSPKAETKRGEYSAFVYRSLTQVLDNSTMLTEIEVFKSNQNGGTITVGTLSASQNGTRVNVSGAKAGQKYEVWDGQTKIGESTVNTAGRATITVSPAVQTAKVYNIKVIEGSQSKIFTKTFTNINENEDPNVLTALTNLQALVDSTSTLKEEDYTPATWSVLTAVLSDCRAMLENPTYVLSDILTLTTQLQTAIDNLVTKEDLRLIKERLRVLIEEIRTLNTSNLNAADLQRLTNALNSGSSLLNGPDQPYKTYADKIDELILLISNLNLSADKEDLINLINDSLSLREQDHTPETFGPFKTKLQAAIAIRDNVRATQPQVETAKTELSAAKSALVLKELTISPQVKGIEIKASDINTAPTTIGGIINQTTPRIGFSTIDLALGQLADASVLAGDSLDNAFVVPQNSLLSFDVRLTYSGVLAGGQITLYVLKKQPNGQYKNVWEEEVNFFTLLGIPMQNKYNLSVTDLDGGEYVIAAAKTSGINLAVLGGEAIVFSNRVLIDSSPTVNANTPAVTTGVSGTFASSVNTSAIELLSVKRNDTAGTPSFTPTVNGKYGQLVVNRTTGAYTYKSNGDPTSIGKVDVFEYRLKNSLGQTEIGKLYMRVNPVGTTLNWNAQNLEQAVSLTNVGNKAPVNVMISQSGTKITALPTASYTGTSTLTGTAPAPVLTDFIDIAHPNDVISFQRIKSGANDREIRYDVLNEQGTVVASEVFDFHTEGSITSGPVTYIKGLPKGKYKVRATVIERAAFTFGLTNLSVSRNQFNSTTANGDFSAGNGYVHPSSLLYVEGSYVSKDGFQVEGEYGVLTVNKNGSFTYAAHTNGSPITNFSAKAFADENAFGKYETFEFKYVAPNGDAAAGTVRINISGSSTPQTPTGDPIPLVSSTSASGATGDLIIAKVNTQKYGSTITLG